MGEREGGGCKVQAHNVQIIANSSKIGRVLVEWAGMYKEEGRK
jgi:hypothetical protein